MSLWSLTSFNSPFICSRNYFNGRLAEEKIEKSLSLSLITDSNAQPAWSICQDYFCQNDTRDALFDMDPKGCWISEWQNPSDSDLVVFTNGEQKYRDHYGPKAKVNTTTSLHHHSPLSFLSHEFPRDRRDNVGAGIFSFLFCLRSSIMQLFDERI